MPRLDITPQWLAAAANKNTRPALFVQVTLVSGPIYVWSGVGNVSWNGATWLGVGQFGGISNIEEGADVQARGIVLTLSGVDPTLLSGALREFKQGLPAIVYLGLFDINGLFVPYPINTWTGRTDQPTITVDGETATISVSCENRLVEMNTSVERRYTAEDQAIAHPGDKGFDFVNALQSVTVYFGRHPDGQNNWTVQGHSA